MPKVQLKLRVILCWLVYFGLQEQAATQTNFIWDEDRAVAIQFSWPSDIETSDLVVTLRDSDQPIFGRWSETGSQYRFYPALPFRYDKQYVVKTGDKLLLEFSMPPSDKPPTRLVKVYPSNDTVPENLLKLHLQFSAPMGERYSEDFMTVMDEEGDTLSNIFLPLQPELWNDAHNLLTLWLDPGRIKRGIGPNLLHGLPLNEGKSYKIMIASSWKDRSGLDIEKVGKKMLIATSAKREVPKPERWQLSVPSRQSHQALILRFNTSLDYVLAQECISVWHETHQLAGEVILAQQESQWHFTPADPWPAGNYSLKIEARLEDLAGNNLNHLFDRDIKAGANSPEQDHFILTFEIE